MERSFKQRLRDNQLVLAMGIAQARTVDVVMMAGACGFDAIWVDLEHTATSLETCAMLCTAAVARGLTPLVRVPSHDHQYMTRVLDTGALGVVVPHVDTKEEAQHIVRTCRFPPAGQRSMIGPNAANGYRPGSFQDIIDFANRETILIAMVETPGAVQRAEEIASVDGLDMVLIGPVDLTTEMGIVGQFRHERFLSAAQTVAQACRRQGKAFGIAGIKDPGLLADLVGMGLRFINVGNDTGFMMEAAQAQIAKVRGIAVPPAA